MQSQNKHASRRRAPNAKQQRGEDVQNLPNATAVKDVSKRRQSYNTMSPAKMSSGHYGGKGGGHALTRRAQEYEAAPQGDADEKIPLHAELEILITQAMHEDPVREETKQAIYDKCKSNVIKLSYHSHGCRLLQNCFGLLEDDAKLKELADELQGHVLEASVNMHGNHVLQKAIDLLRPSDANYMLQELTAGPKAKDFVKDGWYQPWSATQIARSKYGCRVLERVIEHFLPNHNSCIEFLQPVIDDCQALCKDQYGNFIIQHLLEHGTDDHKNAIVQVVKADLKDFAVHQHACSVLDKALSYTNLQNELAEEILNSNCLLVEMASKIRIGYTAVQRMLVMMDGSMLNRAREQLSAIRNSLKETKQGKELFRKLWPDELDESVEETLSRSRDRRKDSINS